jgi:hypothetical protein
VRGVGSELCGEGGGGEGGDDIGCKGKEEGNMVNIFGGEGEDDKGEGSEEEREAKGYVVS